MKTHSPAGKTGRDATEVAMFDERLPVGQLLLMGFQHLLVVTPASIAVPLILASALELDAATTGLLVSGSFLSVGLATFIHAVGFGIVGTRLPIMFGCSFAPLGPMIMIGRTYGMAALFGAVIASGVLILASTFIMEKVLAIFPKVVVGCFVTVMGIWLAPVAMKDLAGGAGAADFGSSRNLLLGVSVLIAIILMEKFGRGMFRALALLLGIVIGSIAAYPLGMISLNGVAEASWFQFIPPLHFGAPEFHLVPILLVSLFCVINILQCIGGYSVLDEVTGSATSRAQVVAGVRAQSMAQILAGGFNSFATTIFKENLGLIALSRIKSRWVIVTASVMAVFVAVLPKVAALITAVPKPVLGGATLYLFGIITAAGLSILGTVDFSKNNHFTIVGTSLAIGIGAGFVPEAFDQLPETLKMLLGDGLFLVAVSAVVLNIFFNGVRARDIEHDVATAGARSRHVRSNAPD